MKPSKILIVEDDSDIAFLLDRAFRKDGFSTEVRHHGGRILESIARFQPDLVLLDIMLPDVNGYTLCRIVKDAPSVRETKIIMLTAKSEEEDILEGFRAGADDFVTKPFHVHEVLARTKAVLRRHNETRISRRDRQVQQGGIMIDDTKHEVRLNGDSLDLTISEYKLLRLLATQPDRVFTREQLSNCISDTEPRSWPVGNSRNIDVHIRSLRRKLGNESLRICTLRGVGYYFQRA